MIGFVVPIAPKNKIKNWSHSNQLLERTIQSLVNQNNSEFKIFVVHEDKPEIHCQHPGIIFVKANCSTLNAEQMDDYNTHVQKYFKPGYDQIMLNKGYKINLGSRISIDEGCSHVMAVDSDDLISNRIAQHVVDNKESPGWQVQRGYTWNDGSKIILRHNQLHGINGSTHIIRKDLVQTTVHSKTFFDYTLFESHGYTKKRIFLQYSEALEPLPFRGTVVVQHTQNTSGDFFFNETNLFKEAAKSLLRGRLVSKQIRREFCCYGLPKQDLNF